MRSYMAWLLAAWLTVVCPLVPSAKAADPKPRRGPTTRPISAETAPLTHYKGREIAQTMHYTGAPWLVRESREREEDCTTMLANLKLKPGQVVCDLGCGNGFYTLKMAKLVGDEGKVLAVEIQQPFLDMLKKRAEQEKIKNIEMILGTIADPKLPDGKLDLLLLVDVYHEMSNPEEMLVAIRKSLKPTGRVALVEFRLEDKDSPIKVLHRMSKEQILKEWLPNGFKLVEQFDGLPMQHMMFFEKDEKQKTGALSK